MATHSSTLPCKIPRTEERGRLQSMELLLSMKKIEEHLPSTMFMRIHRSFIINLDNIIEVKKNHVVLDGEVSLPIGDNYKEAFMNYLSSKIITK